MTQVAYSQRRKTRHLSPDGPAGVGVSLCGAAVFVTEGVWDEHRHNVCARCVQIASTAHLPKDPPPPIAEAEPLPGSVVMAEGISGTAFQRHFSDGLWHSTTGRVRTWQELVDAEIEWKRPGLFLLFDSARH